MNEYIESNRDKRIKAKRCLTWCGCDTYKISLTEKCPICSRRINRKKIKINPPKK